MYIYTHTYSSAKEIYIVLGFPGGSEGKESACNAGDLVRSLGQEDPVEKGMAIHFSILAWEMRWTEEPDRLQTHKESDVT